MENVTLNNGVSMPMLGYGVFQTPPEDTARCVREALEVGYRLIDTAQAYGNEKGVGVGIKDSGIARDDVFITSKVWVSSMNEERARVSIDQTLRNLDTDYIDLMLLHQAMGDYPGAWRALEDAYEAGKIRAIGVSNFYPERLIDIASLARIVPAVNQIETHPFCQQDKAHAVMEDLGIIHEAWAPFAEGKHDIFHHPVLAHIAQSHHKSVGQVILRALIHQGIVVIPKTVHRDRMEENFQVFDFELSNEELSAFASLNDPTIPRIFDHFNTDTVSWLLGDLVKKTQLNGQTLY